MPGFINVLYLPKRNLTPEQQFHHEEIYFHYRYSKLFTKLNYDMDIFIKLNNVFIYNFEKLSFLEKCEEYNLDNNTVRTYLNIDTDLEFESLRLKTYHMVKIEGTCSKSDHSIVHQIHKSVNQNTLDYYEKRAIKYLSKSGLALLHNMAVSSIDSTIRLVDRIDYLLVDFMVKKKEKCKAESKNWGKILDLIQEIELC